MRMIEMYGVSVLPRRTGDGIIMYFHAQIGPEEPENNTLATSHCPRIAVAQAVINWADNDYHIELT